MHPEFPPVAFFAAFSLFFPLPWHWRARNVATLCIIGWFFTMNMISGINTIIWAGNVLIVVPVWCDITTKLIIGANLALPAACLCICMHLEQVSSVRVSRWHITNKRKRQYFELFMCIGLPMVVMVLHYIVQGHRFDIIEDYGCWPTTYFSIPSVFIVWVPPILMSLGALIFAVLAMRHFMMRRLTFAAHLNASNSALTTSRYFRLMAMAALQMFWSLSITIYTFWFTTITLPFRPWKNWDFVHSDFLRVDQYLSSLTPILILRSFNASWWLLPISTFIFVAFFSFGQDAIDEYSRFIQAFKTTVLRIPRVVKDMKFFSSVFSEKKATPLPISSPKLITTSSDFRTSFKSYCPSPTSPTSSFATLKPSHASWEMPNVIPKLNYKGPKAVGSFSDLSCPTTPSTAVPSYSNVILTKPLPPIPSSPITPTASSYPRRPGCTFTHDNAVSPRPLTYPSNVNDSSHLSLNQVAFAFPKMTDFRSPAS